MPVQQFVNGNATTTAAADATAAATTITPAATTGFPATPQFTILNRATGELMLVTAVNAGPTWTVVRGIGGTTAQAVVGTGGSPHNLDYSITREMLLLGVPMKLDEAVLSADTAAGVLTLTVPTWARGLGLRSLRMELSICTSAVVGANTYALMRINGDTSTTTYFVAGVYHGSSSANVVFSALTHARLGYIGRAVTASNPANFTFYEVDLQGFEDIDRWRAFIINARWSDGTGGAHYRMHTAGEWRNTAAAITTISFSADADTPAGTWAGGTLRAGSRAMLYGVP